MSVHYMDENAGLVKLYLHMVLLRLGGQVSFTFAELEDMRHTYRGCRAVMDVQRERITIVLQTHHAFTI